MPEPAGRSERPWRAPRGVRHWRAAQSAVLTQRAPEAIVTRMSPAVRYALFQLPGAVGAAVVAWALWRWAGLPGWAAGGLAALWVAKDVALYPWMRAAHQPVPGGAAALIGRRAVARGRLAARGTVAVGSELWRAELAPPAAPIEPGAALRVVAVRGLTLIVAPLEETDG
jgi:membrane protein implicated in regulation of membrane protease activity